MCSLMMRIVLGKRKTMNLSGLEGCEVCVVHLKFVFGSITTNQN